MKGGGGAEREVDADDVVRRDETDETDGEEGRAPAAAHKFCSFVILARVD